MSSGPVAVSFDTAIASLSPVTLNRLFYSSVFEEVKLSLMFDVAFAPRFVFKWVKLGDSDLPDKHLLALMIDKWYFCQEPVLFHVVY